MEIVIDQPCFSTLHALVDTGAQGNAIISSRFIKKHNIKTQICSRVDLKAFDGSTLDTINRTTLPLQCCINGNFYNISFLVANHLKEDAILGLDWLKRNSIVIDCVDGTLHRREKVFKIRAMPASQIPPYLTEFQDVFDLGKANQLPPYNLNTAISINLVPEATIPQSFPYKLSKQEEIALKQEIDQGLASGKIVCSDAFGSSPVLFVKKDSGKLRMCVDYRKVNDLTVSEQAILPDIQEVLASLGDQSDKKPLYSKLDLKGAFNLLRLTKGSEELSTFITKFGKYK